MTYDNARLPEALMRAGHVLGEPSFGEAGLAALAFYESVTIENGIHVPIGNHGWYVHGGRRARYEQQPLEPWAHRSMPSLPRSISTGETRHFAVADLAPGMVLRQKYAGRDDGATAAAATTVLTKTA